MAVPAEELVEVEFREDLRQRGVIGYYGGKQEFLRRGYMDGVDMAFMFHTTYGDGAFELPIGATTAASSKMPSSRARRPMPEPTPTWVSMPSPPPGWP